MNLRQNTFLFGVLSILSACSSQSNPASPVSSLFDNRLKCGAQYAQFETELRADDRVPFTMSHLDELFYSPQLQTCVAAFHTTYEQVPGGDTIAYLLQDALSRKILFDMTLKQDSQAEDKWKARRVEYGTLK